MSQVVYVLGGKCPGGKCPGGKCPGGKCLGGICPVSVQSFSQTTFKPAGITKYLFTPVPITGLELTFYCAY